MKNIYPIAFTVGLFISIYVLIKRFRPQFLGKLGLGNNADQMVYPTSFFAPSKDYSPIENDYSRFSYFK